MKTQSTVEIPVLQDLGTGRWYFHFNHKIVERKNGEETEYINEADTVLIEGQPDAEKIKKALSAEGFKLTKDVNKQIETAFLKQ